MWAVCTACRFLCRQRLGYRADKNAEYLTPVPQESVVYGSGETAVVLSKVCVADPKLHVVQQQSTLMLAHECVLYDKLHQKASHSYRRQLFRQDQV